MDMSKTWYNILGEIDYAFQPIVNMHTGLCFGVEALLRGYQQAGFNTIRDLFTAAYNEGLLFEIDQALREIVLEKFLTIPFYHNIKLFYNLDNRLVEMADFDAKHSMELLRDYPVSASNVVFEISEQDKWEYNGDSERLIMEYKNETCRIALDDFGAGFAGLQVLYSSDPNYVKIDRFFINNICKDARKKLFVSNIVNLAHTLGIQVVAEGVETESEYYACRDIGCDYVQGYLVQKPVLAIHKLYGVYENVRNWNSKDKRSLQSDIQLVREQMELIRPIFHPKDSISEVFEHFRIYSKHHYIPVLNTSGEPLGIIHEQNLKEYVYSPYGRELLKNSKLGKTPAHFLTKVPTAEISTSLEKILEIYSVDIFDGECIIITENGKYSGVLTAKTLLTALNEKNIAAARDLNPLTKLPGNALINEYINFQLLDLTSVRSFVYFDFDNFKPFNDVYGFRIGDRVIQIFAEILARYKSNRDDVFIGHIGGDDFFVGIQSEHESDCEDIEIAIRQIQTEFCETIISLYSEKHREEGCIIAKDRYGVERSFDLLTVSAATLHIPEQYILQTDDEFNSIMSQLKKEAKESYDDFASTLFVLEETAM